MLLLFGAASHFQIRRIDTGRRVSDKFPVALPFRLSAAVEDQYECVATLFGFRPCKS